MKNEMWNRQVFESNQIADQFKGSYRLRKKYTTFSSGGTNLTTLALNNSLQLQTKQQMAWNFLMNPS